MMRDAALVAGGLLLLWGLWAIYHVLRQTVEVLISFRDALHAELRSLAECLDSLRRGLAPTDRERLNRMYRDMPAATDEEEAERREYQRMEMLAELSGEPELVLAGLLPELTAIRKALEGQKEDDE